MARILCPHIRTACFGLKAISWAEELHGVELIVTSKIDVVNLEVQAGIVIGLMDINV